MNGASHRQAGSADGQAKLVAVHPLPGQARPLRVWAARPLAVIACEALLEADRLLAAQGALLAVRDELQGVTS